MHKWWNWRWLREERKNPSLQIKVNRMSIVFYEEKIKQILQQCKLKDKNGIFIIKMHFVGLFIVLMIIWQ
jgi:hypothetical protein